MGSFSGGRGENGVVYKRCVILTPICHRRRVGPDGGIYATGPKKKTLRGAKPPPRCQNPPEVPKPPPNPPPGTPLRLRRLAPSTVPACAITGKRKRYYVSVVQLLGGPAKTAPGIHINPGEVTLRGVRRPRRPVVAPGPPRSHLSSVRS